MGPGALVVAMFRNTGSMYEVAFLRELGGNLYFCGSVVRISFEHQPAPDAEVPAATTHIVPPAKGDNSVTP